MTLPIFVLVSLTVIGTSFVSGIFGMAGGMVLMGVLLTVMPVAEAMVLHGIIQAASNGWRAALWRRDIRWPLVLRYFIGLSAATLIFSFLRFLPSEAVSLMVLGISPFIVLAIPQRFVIQAEHRFGAELCGFLCTGTQMVSGVSAPVLDMFFVRASLDRRQIIATKAGCQVATHLAKLIYFGSFLTTGADGLSAMAIAAFIAMAIAGTSFSRVLFHRLSDAQFRQWTRVIIMISGPVYFTQGLIALQR